MSEKSKMNSTASSYIKKVNDAKNACVEAKTKLTKSQSAISGKWKGDSGHAMYQALSNLSGELDDVINCLNSAASKMRAESRWIYDNWPEDETEKQKD